jgi:WD40 repeat protein
MPDALDGDYYRSRAVLIGTWDYRHLNPVPAAEHSLDRMRTLLASPLCGGWPEDRVSVIDNRARLGELPHELVVWLREAVDVALFYYVGHGQYDDDDRLCLALGDSSPDPVLRTTTSLTFDAVRQAFRASKAATKIAILDCCFAGLAAGRDGQLAGTPDLPRSPGFYLMMASGEFNTAWFETTAESERPQTYFTKYLVNLIEAGVPGQPTGLTLGPIFDKVADAMVRDCKPAPGCRVSDHAADFVFARNPAIQSAHQFTTATNPSFDLDDPPEQAETPRGSPERARGWRPSRRAFLLAGIGATVAIAVPVSLELSSLSSGSHTGNTSPGDLVTIRAGGAVRLLDNAHGAGGDGTVKLWTVATNALTKSFTHTVVNSWASVRSLEQVTAFNHTFTAAVDVAFGPDGTRLAVANGDGTISLWNVATGAESTLPYLNPQLWNSSATYLAFDPAGGMLASTYDSPNFRLWDLADQSAGTTVNTGSGNWVASLAFSPSGAVLATASGNGNPGNTTGDGLLQLWDTSTGSTLATLAHTNSPPKSLAYGSDGKTLANLRNDGIITLWDAEARRSTATLAAPGSGITCIASGPGTLLASGSEDGTVTLWDTASRKSLAALSTGTDTTIQCVAISPNGKSVASAGVVLTVWAIS